MIYEINICLLHEDQTGTFDVEKYLETKLDKRH